MTKFRCEFRVISPQEYNTPRSLIPIQVTIVEVDEPLESVEAALRRKMEIPESHIVRVEDAWPHVPEFVDWQT